MLMKIQGHLRFSTRSFNLLYEQSSYKSTYILSTIFKRLNESYCIDCNTLCFYDYYKRFCCNILELLFLIFCSYSKLDVFWNEKLYNNIYFHFALRQKIYHIFSNDNKYHYYSANFHLLLKSFFAYS